MVVLAVTWIANEGCEQQVAGLFRRLSKASEEEPGCLQFAVHQGVEDPRKFFLYEQYRDEAAVEAHRQTEHFREIARGELLKYGKRAEGTLYRPLD